MKLGSEWLGLKDFETVYGRQLESWTAIQTSSEPNGMLIGCEHNPVVTLGRSTGPEDILITELKNVRVDRGGKATIHSPGQLVIYPIIPLRKLKWGVVAYIDFLNRVTSEWSKKLGEPIQFCVEDPGYYLGEKKVGFLGIRVKNGISLHGLSLNIYNDIGLFDHIISCGVKNRPLTNFKSQLSLHQLFELWAKTFVEEFATQRDF